MTEEIKGHKVILLGNIAVGKTAIISHFIYKEIDEIYKTTLTTTYLEKTLKINDKRVVLNIWDKKNFLHSIIYCLKMQKQLF